MCLSPQVSLALWPRAQVGLAQGHHYPFIPRNACSQRALAPNHFSPPLPQCGAFPSFPSPMTSDVEETHLTSAPLQVSLCHGHGEILAPGEAALLLPPPPRVQPPLPLQVQRLRLQPLHTGEHCSPPKTRWKGGPCAAHSSSWDPGSNPGRCQLQIRQWSWQLEGCW